MPDGQRNPVKRTKAEREWYESRITTRVKPKGEARTVYNSDVERVKFQISSSLVS